MRAGEGGGVGRGRDHPSETDLKLQHLSLHLSLDKYAKHGFWINTQHFRGIRRDKDEVTWRTRGKTRGRWKANSPSPPKKHKGRWKTTPAKLDCAAVFHLPQLIAGMIAEHVPASNNEVQMHQVSSATHHHRLWPCEIYLRRGSSPTFSEHCRVTVTTLTAQGLQWINSWIKFSANSKWLYRSPLIVLN